MMDLWNDGTCGGRAHRRHVAATVGPLFCIPVRPGAWVVLRGRAARANAEPCKGVLLASL